jgi:predicted AAA+ superfamily ATPase
MIDGYRQRFAESRVEGLARLFKVVLVAGARQVGKSTMLAHLFPEVRTFVFDPVQDLYGARQDPDLFLDTYGPPLILDEIQYAAELLPAIKRRVDRNPAPGQYILTGSQNLGLLKSVAESLAGRVGIIDLGPLSMWELEGIPAEQAWLPRYLSGSGELTALRAAPGVSLKRSLWRGGLPGLLPFPDDAVADYLRSYVQTYVERDVLTVQAIRQRTDFDRFLGLLGALSGQEINGAQIGRDVGVDPQTARNWLELLHLGYQWWDVPPYHGNAVKRLSNKRKGYLVDTGLACWLQRLSSPDAVMVSRLLGSLFETLVVNSIRAQATLSSLEPRLWHWRTDSGAEVDLVLEYEGRLYPIEIKCKTNPTGHDTRGLRAFRDTYADAQIAPGLIICACDEARRLDQWTVAIPWNGV